MTSVNKLSRCESHPFTGNCAVRLLPVLWERSYYSWAVLPLPLRACGGSPVKSVRRRRNQALTLGNLDHYGSKEDLVWMDQSLICTPHIFFSTAFIVLSWYYPMVQSIHSCFSVLGEQRSLNWSLGQPEATCIIFVMFIKCFLSRPPISKRIWSFFETYVNWNSHRQYHYWKRNGISSCWLRYHKHKNRCHHHNSVRTTKPVFPSQVALQILPKWAPVFTATPFPSTQDTHCAETKLLYFTTQDSSELSLP